MKSLYVSQQGCYISLKNESLLVKQGETILNEVQLPLLEQVLIFGKSQVTTQAIISCLGRNITIVYLSTMGYCYGRLIALAQGYRYLSRYQQQISPEARLLVAKKIVWAKLKNSRVLLRRQGQKVDSEILTATLKSLEYLIEKCQKAVNISQLMGYEGAGAASYFNAFGECLQSPDFLFLGRSRRPPGNPVNAMLSFGYQILWNHLLALIEVQGLDPYFACLHQDNERHPSLASDLIEEFRAPIIDSLVLWLIKSKIMNSLADFEYHNGGCFLNTSGRKKFLTAFVRRMEERVDTGDEEKQPRWDLLMCQVKNFKRFVYEPSLGYQPYLIR
ncbi:MAG: CRISPR-associated endonuclease Cas1 [Gomphosphaeria aponina SAG 52.96 = DSM 107014]|uniref:CRISPR-associated endonuclease Cas1 n=1 Tax=Gomphosphaeria aponina SAG 52.96 = DSM 107014 TaxID=1521640 RepID=A0A941GZ53_9CHRO|nr:CRISPR-associated endonuclease Cas1 [Gomphosphaeria aponina SAG 52.96 = DSM 107014]